MHLVSAPVSTIATRRYVRSNYHSCHVRCILGICFRLGKSQSRNICHQTCPCRTASPGLAPSDTRQCSICKELKSPDEFIRDARRASGLDARCKLCRRQQHHNRKMQHLAAGGVPTVAQKECTRCHVVKPASGFKRHSYTNSGLVSAGCASTLYVEQSM